jgi:hypothetical protein
VADIITGVKESQFGWQILCSLCGNSGGNYPTKETAEICAWLHGCLPHEKKG